MSSSSSPTVGTPTAVTPQLVEQWILQSNQPGVKGGQQWQATLWLKDWTAEANDDPNHNNNNNAVVTILQTLLEQSVHETVQFYALTTLGRRRTLNDLQRYNLRQSLLYGYNPGTTFLRNKVAWILARLLWQDVPMQWTTVEQDLLHHLSVHQPATFLKTVDTVMEEFCAILPINDTNDTTSPAASNNNNNNILEQQQQQDDDEVLFSAAATSSATFFASKEAIRRVKDFLKGYITTAGVVTGRHLRDKDQLHDHSFLDRLFERVVALLEESVQAYTINRSTEASTTLLLALQTIQRFFSWTAEVPATMATTTTTASASTTTTLPATTPHKVIQLLLHLVQQSPNYPPAVSIAALQVWQEWCSSHNELSSVNDGTNRKIAIVTTLLEHVHTSNVLPYQGESQAEIEVVIEVAKLINAIGLRVLEDVEQQRFHGNNTSESSNAMFSKLKNQVLDLFFRALAYDDIDVSLAVLPLAGNFTLVLEEPEPSDDATSNNNNNKFFQQSPQQQQQFLGQMLRILYEQFKYPADFAYDYEDEIDAEEIAYRGELSKLYVKLVRVAPEPCLQFLCQHVAAIQTTSLAAAPTRDVEAFLRLIYHYCEGIRPPPGLKTLMNKSTTFRSLLIALHKSDIAQHSHREVLCLYYETAVRYYPIFVPATTTATNNPEDGKQGEEPLQLLSRVLQALTGPQGLQHAHARVRSRCCYLLLRLVKSVVTLLRPFVETAVSGINNLLLSSAATAQGLLRPDDMLYLFETMGLLLGKTGLDAVDQQRYLTQLMTPHARSIEELLTRASQVDDLMKQEEFLAGSIAAMAHLSKGFSIKSPEQVKVVLLETLPISLQVLKALPTSEPIRNKTMILLQRMILCLGADDKLLSSMPLFLSILIEYSNDEDIVFVSQLICQLCIKFKTKAVPILDASLLPFLRKCQSLMPATADVTNGEGAPNGGSIPPHLRTQQVAIQKVVFSVLQHVVANQVTAILISSTNVASLESILQTVSDGAIHVSDPVAKKTCVKFFVDLLNEWVVKAVTSGQVVYQSGLLTFCTQHLIPGMFSCIFSSSFDEKDALHARVLHEFAQVLFIIKHHVVTKANPDEARMLYEHCIGPSIAKVANVSPLPSTVITVFATTPSAVEMQIWLNELLGRFKRNDPRHEVLC